MRHFFPLNWIQWLTLALAFTVACTTPILYLRIQDVQHHQNDALRSIMCQAEHAVQVRPGIPHKQRVQALHFYQHALVSAHLNPCP